MCRNAKGFCNNRKVFNRNIRLATFDRAYIYGMEFSKFGKLTLSEAFNISQVTNIVSDNFANIHRKKYQERIARFLI
jgi:hypothetical protein